MACAGAERDRGLRDVVAIARARAAAMGMLQEEGWKEASDLGTLPVPTSLQGLIS